MISASTAASRARVIDNREVAPGVWRIPLSIVNAYIVQGDDPGTWLLIDAGLGTSGPAILKMAAERFGPHSPPAAIVLTHGHFDHVGALHSLLEIWDVPIYAHPLELPYLNGTSAYPPPDPAVGGGLMSCLSRVFPRGPIDVRDSLRLLPSDGSVPFASEWEWIHTPGHTVGHVSLFRESDRTLIAGDAFVTTRQESLVGSMLRIPEVWRCPAYYTSDWEAAYDSIVALADLDPEIAATGHGLPMRGARLHEGLAALLENWSEVRPHYGRYVRQPALADEQGVVWTPPPVIDRNLWKIAAVAGVTALAVAAWRRRQQH